LLEMTVYFSKLQITFFKDTIRIKL
jgi:hypothetical protein